MRNKLAIRNWWMMASSPVFVLIAIHNYDLPPGSTTWRYMWVVSAITAVCAFLAAFKTPWEDTI